MQFKPMKQQDVRQALEGHQDILKPAFQASEQFFRSLSCVSCGGEVMAIVNSRAPFKEGSIIPNYLAKCKRCSTEFEPYTGIQITPPGR